MSLGTAKLVADRIKHASSGAPIVVFESNIPNKLDAVFADTSQTRFVLNGLKIEPLGIYTKDDYSPELVKYLRLMAMTPQKRASALRETMGNVVIAGDKIYARVDEQDDPTEVENAMVISFKDPAQFRKAMLTRKAEFLVFGAE